MKCDIIIPVWNQQKHTQACVKSILENTHCAYRLIIIDNGSDRPTAEYLDAVASQADIHLIRNAENKGFVKAVNQGFKMCNAPYVCVMNNDTVATDGWLSELIRIAESNKRIGLVNPSSNNLGRHKGRETIHSYAERLKRFKGQYIEMGACLGFCMLIRGELFKKIGYFDEIFDKGNFEETDYCRRARKAGYISVMAKGAYVHHYMKSSFLQLADYEKSFRKNQSIFNQRWGRPMRMLYIITKRHGRLSDWMKEEALEKARGGNWVWFFFKDRRELPDIDEHSNIKCVYMPKALFEWNCLIRILKKKKKFHTVYIDDYDLLQRIKKYRNIHKADTVLMGEGA